MVLSDLSSFAEQKDDIGIEDDLPSGGQEASGGDVFSAASGSSPSSEIMSLSEDKRRYFYTGVVPYDIPALLSTAKDCGVVLGKVSPSRGDLIPRFFMNLDIETPEPLMRFLSSKAESAETKKKQMISGSNSLLCAAAFGISGHLGDYAIAVPDQKKEPLLYREVVLRLRSATPEQRRKICDACAQVAQKNTGMPLDGLRRTLYIVKDLERADSLKNKDRSR